MRSLLRSVAVGVLAASAGAAMAQSQFAARVVEDGTQTGVRSNIEYESAPGNWQIIKETDPRGALSGQCPGPVRIRANPTPYHWEYRISRPQDCAGQVSLAVERRDTSLVVADLFEFGSESSPIDRQDFAVAYAREVSNGIGGEPRAADGETALLAHYADNPDRLSRAERDSLESLALNRTAREFTRLDVDRDRKLSAAEIRASAHDR